MTDFKIRAEVRGITAGRALAVWHVMPLQDLRADGLKHAPGRLRFTETRKAGKGGFQGRDAGSPTRSRIVASFPFPTELSEEDIALIVETLKDASIHAGAGSAIYL